MTRTSWRDRPFLEPWWSL